MKYLTDLSFWSKIIDGCNEPSPNPYKNPYGKNPPVKRSDKNNLRVSFKIYGTVGKHLGSVTVTIHLLGKFKLVLHTKNELDTTRYFSRGEQAIIPKNHTPIYVYDDAFIIAYTKVETHKLTLMRNMTIEKFEDEVLRLSLAL